MIVSMQWFCELNAPLLFLVCVHEIWVIAVWVSLTVELMIFIWFLEILLYIDHQIACSLTMAGT